MNLPTGLTKGTPNVGTRSHRVEVTGGCEVGETRPCESYGDGPETRTRRETDPVCGGFRTHLQRNSKFYSRPPRTTDDKRTYAHGDTRSDTLTPPVLFSFLTTTTSSLGSDAYSCVSFMDHFSFGTTFRPTHQPT